MSSARRLLWGAAVVVGMAGTFAGGVWLGTQRARASAEWVEGRLISTAIDSVRANALDSLPSEELIRRAVAGMLRELQDPYAAMLRPDGLERYRGTLQGDGRGLGIHLRRDVEHVTVSRVERNSPAWTTGLRSGDRVLFVNGVAAAVAWSARDSTSNAGDTTRFVVQRGTNNDTVAITIVRRSWHMPAVTNATLLSPDVAYVHLGSFSSRAADEAERDIELLVRQGASSLILDLRGNSGGLFEEGVRVASLFLPRGTVVASVIGRSSAEPQVHEARGTRWPHLPLTVLVDRNTASAAELVAAALRDHRRALLVGTHTYGKGFVQRVVKLSPDISLRLTTARWLPPSGQQVERRDGQGLDVTGGIAPNIVVDDGARRDPAHVPAVWGVEQTRAIVEAADSVAVIALRDQWASSSFQHLLELSRMHAIALAPARLGDMTRAAWVTNVARLAAVRVLEVRGDAVSLMRLRASDDPVLRIAMELWEPESLASMTTISRAPVPSTRTRSPVATGTLDHWMQRRFGGVELLADSAFRGGPQPVRAPLPRVVAVHGARGDTIIAIQFAADSISPALPANGMVHVLDPTGGATTASARLIGRRMFRVPRTVSITNTAPWRYGWAYLAVLPPQPRHGSAQVTLRGWLLDATQGASARHASRTAAESVSTR